MNTNENQEETTETEEQTERYFDFYIKKNTMWISIFLSLYVLLDIIAIFLTTSFSFLTIFLYFGILMILIGLVTLYFIWREKDYFWASLASIFLGLAPFIEMIIILATGSLTSYSLITAIISLVIVFVFIILPIFLVFWKYYVEYSKKTD